MRRKRRNHTSSFKARVALATLKGDKTLAELAEQFDAYPNQITDWKKQLIGNTENIFGKGSISNICITDIPIMSQFSGRSGAC
jgi:transposase